MSETRIVQPTVDYYQISIILDTFSYFARSLKVALQIFPYLNCAGNGTPKFIIVSIIKISEFGKQNRHYDSLENVLAR